MKEISTENLMIIAVVITIINIIVLFVNIFLILR